MASCCHGRKLFPGVCKTVIELSRVKETQRVLEKHFFGVTSHDVTMKFTLFGFQWFARLALCITSLLTIQPSSHPATLTCYLLQRHYQSSHHHQCVELFLLPNLPFVKSQNVKELIWSTKCRVLAATTSSLTGLWSPKGVNWKYPLLDDTGHAQWQLHICLEYLEPSPLPFNACKEHTAQG